MTPSKSQKQLFFDNTSTKGNSMKTLLQISTSIFSDGGQSSQLSQRFVDAWRDGNPGATVVVRDLARDPVPHLDAASFGAFLAKPEDRNADQQKAVDFSDGLIAELKAADVIVLGLPMYNFGLPSTLKAYIDQIARAGSTFRYTEKGPVGLVTGKKAYVFATRGGFYKGTAADTQTAYVRDFLAFIGITDVEFVYAEGLAINEASKTSSLAQARREIDVIAAPLALAA
jgi:FMN-dependent NADH-azoreductase